MSGQETKKWYCDQGWREINAWLCELAAKGCNRVFICNFEIIPEGADKVTLIEIFNKGSTSWRLGVDEDGDFVCTRKK